jgi:4-amino-4-deoxy-L-arabinose transferase-like glycosyltransferase
MNLASFRANFKFEKKGTITFLQLFFLFAISLFIRLAYLSICACVCGDGGTYAGIAQNIAHGDFASIDTFWINLYCYYEALIAIFGASIETSAIVSSLLPGLFLFVPITYLANELYGKKVAFLAGLLSAIHPRLVEYSSNGNPETFLLFWLSAALLFLLKEKPLFFGIAFAIVAACRNEFILLFVLLLFFCALIQKKFRFLIYSSMAFLAVLSAYAMLSFSTVHTFGLFQKSTNITRQYSEQVNMRDAARETYGLVHKTPETVSICKKIPSNIFYMIKKLPGVILSPLIFFVFLLLYLVPVRSKTKEWPLWITLLFPIVFYPLIQVEPRYLFALLIPLNIFGAAGFYAVENFINKKGVTFVLYFAVLAPCIILSLYKSYVTERNYSCHRQIGAWIKTHIPENEKIAGCGYGWASSSCSAVGRPSIRRPFVESGEELVAFMKERGIPWLILYEAYIRQADYELLPCFTNGIPGLTKEYEMRDVNGYRIQIYHLKKLK